MQDEKQKERELWRELLSPNTIDAELLEAERLDVQKKTNEIVDTTFKHYMYNIIIGGSILSLFAGFGGGVVFVTRKMKKIPLGPVGIGLRALGYATVLCGAVATTVVYATKKVLGVQNMEEFSNYLRRKINPKSEKVRNILSKVDNSSTFPPTEEEIDQMIEISSVMTQELEE